MGFITLNSLNFQGPLQSVQVVSVYVKLASSPDILSSYQLVSNNVSIQKNGFFFTPLTIPNLTDGVEYTVKIVNNCGGNGYKANFFAGQTTAVQTTQAPTTEAPTTVPPTTGPQTTAPVTVPPTTAPVTIPPTTAPVTVAPTTAPPPTTVPETTLPPTTPGTAYLNIFFGVFGLTGSLAKLFAPSATLVGGVINADDNARGNTAAFSPTGNQAFRLELTLQETRNVTVRGLKNGNPFFEQDYSGTNIIAQTSVVNVAPGDAILVDVYDA